MQRSDNSVAYSKPKSRPWWHTEHVEVVRERAADFPMSELRGLAEDMKGTLSALQTKLSLKASEVSHVRDMAKEMGPAVAFDATRLAKAVSERYGITVDEAEELVDDLDWWKSAQIALGYIKQKHSTIVAEITRRRVGDAEQAVFDIKGKVRRAFQLLRDSVDVKDLIEDDCTDIERAVSLLKEVDDRLTNVGSKV